MRQIRETARASELELARGVVGGIVKGSWHDQFAASPWIYVGGLVPELCEGDVLCVCSEFGEVEDIVLMRDSASGASSGFAFLRYSDPRSAILAVDNLNGADVCGRALLVQHKLEYRRPSRRRPRSRGRESECESEGSDGFPRPGHAYDGVELENEYTLFHGVSLFPVPQRGSSGTTATDAPRSDDKDRDKGKDRAEEHRKDSRRRHRHHSRARRHSTSRSRSPRRRDERTGVTAAAVVPRGTRVNDFVTVDASGEVAALAAVAPAMQAAPGVLSWRGRLDARRR